MKRAGKATATKQQPDSQMPLLLTIPETCRLLGLKSRDAVYSRIRSGRLRAVDMAEEGSTKTLLRVPLDAVHDYIRSLPPVHNP
ncbi:helix-turn-helix domain-containing protein [Nonomuraea zeae]|uniref:Helix-turn-helix domain-containing protein n=1 Tax=Nonomuraea zeae TaxID=1642303 RepID=A0A5S4H3X1_9ACTN|nr:helix-turn-helix domain-containing protein [Nonomuraea zeae]TMR39632.1 helix-turn-helix domain-containing protein [Nonomuraea zeae]